MRNPLRPRAVLALLALALLLPALAATPARGDDKVLTVGIVPQSSAMRLAKAWVPFLNEVSDKAGVTLRFKTAPNIGVFHKRVKAGAYDFIFDNPLSYVHAHDWQGYRALAHRKGHRLKGILVVRKDSAFHKVTDLKGRRVVLPDPTAFAAHILNLQVLTDAGLDPARDLKLRTVSSHDSAYLLVFSHQADAAGGVMRTLNAMPARIRSQLRVLHQTAGYTPHAFAAKGSVPAAVANRVRDALIAVADAPDHGDVRRAIHMPKGFEAASDADYAAVRKVAAALAKAKK